MPYHICSLILIYFSLSLLLSSFLLPPHSPTSIPLVLLSDLLSLSLSFLPSALSPSSFSLIVLFTLAALAIIWWKDGEASSQQTLLHSTGEEREKGGEIENWSRQQPFIAGPLSSSLGYDSGEGGGATCPYVGNQPDGLAHVCTLGICECCTNSCLHWPQPK